MKSPATGVVTAGVLATATIFMVTTQTPATDGLMLTITAGATHL